MKKATVHAPFDPAHRVPVQTPLLHQPEPVRANRLHHTPPVGQHLHALDLEHRPVLHHSLKMIRPRSAGGEDHAESGRARLDAPTDHESVTGFEDVENSGHPREGERADEDGRVEPGVSLVSLYRDAPVRVLVREREFD
jgi:hypothetical protein